MSDLRITKATYYVPESGPKRGTDVTDELRAEVVDGRLVYNGIYNRIFPDNFPGIVKKLKVEMEYKGKKYTKFYNENDKVNLPYDLGENLNLDSHAALNLTKSAKNNIFINSKVNGGIKVSGSDNEFINTYINSFKQKHPIWFFTTALATIIGFITGLMYLAQYFGFIPDSLKTQISINSELSTTTPNLSDLFSKALSYDTVAERQDFLGKYVGKQVYDNGVIEEVSRVGDKFLIDIDLGKASIVCPQEKTNVLEEQYPFLKGKQVMLYGSFTYTTIFGHGDNIISIDPCSLEIK